MARAQEIDYEQVVWNDAGLAFHADSGLPVTGEVVKRWPGGVKMTEGHYVEGVHQGAGHRYYSDEGRSLARRDAVPTFVPPPLREAPALVARRAVLDRGELLRERIRELKAAMERHSFMRQVLVEQKRRTAEEEASRRWHKIAELDLAPLVDRARGELSALETWYKAWVPRVDVARCPHSQRVVAFPIDTVDLDGWFWDYRRPARPYHWEELPPTWLAMTGAVRLGEPLRSVSFEAQPGPEVPYVIPRILDHRQDVRAVITELPIGPHTGWAITYFALGQLGAKLVSTWGEATYHWHSDDGSWHWEDGGWTTEYFDFNNGDNDYDLTPWLRSGKLLWIAPGDRQLTLRSGESACPYTGLPGSRHMSHIHDGKIWRAGKWVSPL